MIENALFTFTVLSDIIYSTMNKRKLLKASRLLDQMRLSPQKAADLEHVARKLGLKPVSRGKEPTWESDDFPFLDPISIPHHGGRDLAPGTKNSVINCLEAYAVAWEEKLSDVDEDGREGAKDDDDDDER